MSRWRTVLLGLGITAAWALPAWLRLRRAVHILQLEEYENRRLLRWARQHWLVEGGRPLLLSALLPGWAVAALIRRDGATLESTIGGVIAGARVSTSAEPSQARKPLTVTARVKRLYGGLAAVAVLAGGTIWFLARLAGTPRRRALAVVAPLTAWSLLAGAPLVAAAANLLVWPVEEANRRRYRNEAVARLRAVSPRIVAITGSYGKTTTKELAAAVLETKYRVLKTPRSFNTVMGITRTIREELRDEHEVFVVEMGAYKPGDIRDLCRFVGGPEVSAIVGINEQHLERMGSIENTMRAKYEIVEETRPGGVAILNVDNSYCERLAAQTTHVRVVRVGADAHEPPVDLRAGNVTVTPKLMRFDVSDGEQTVTVRTRLLGRHLLPNFLIALAIGRELGVDLRAAVTRLGRVEPVDHRLDVSESDGLIVIDDAYSSNVDGARAALQLLAELPAQRRFLVTPGIVELGPVEEQRNRELGEQAAAVCDTLLAVGREPGRFVREGALAAGMPDERVVACATLAEAQAWLREHTRRGDAVLFENDLPDNYA
jgi:UDP-N-acetylmuramoyl-tripeptide--D-alanyl-D-alanine ligase